MDNILEGLFLGDINPSQDNMIMSDHDYQEARNKEFQAEEKLEKTLSEEQKELLKEYSDTTAAVEYAVAKYHFLNGYILGVKMMMEILK